jgi:predicted RecB family endonuclease
MNNWLRALPDEVISRIMDMLPSVYDSLRLRAAEFLNVPPSQRENELLEMLRIVHPQQSETLCRENQIRLGVDSIVKWKRNKRLERAPAKKQTKRKGARPHWNGQAVTIKKMDRVVSATWDMS